MNIPIYTNWKKGREKAAADKLAKTKANDFKSWFKFHHENLKDPIYQHEVYVKLGMLAFAAKKALEGVKENPSSYHCKSHYDNAMGWYFKAVNCLKYFSPEMAAALPHWTNFPGFLDDLLNGKPEKVFTAINPPDPASALIPEMGGWREQDQLVN